ncbi:hypothetical protein N9L06_06675 [Mariniblastus sp.]|nr:hypothetical protein [Mariniblastus sp.]
MNTRSLSSFKMLFQQAGLVCFALLCAVGCSQSNDITSSPSDQSSGTAIHWPPLPDVPDAPYEFNSGMMLQAGGEPIAVESPGYACPTIADVDGDGVDDLVVGQFNGGKMHFYRNLSAADGLPKYASQQWISTGSTPAEVPGVS